MAYKSQGLEPLIPRLPSALAILLEEYNQEQDDYLALHRLCGLLEITARFLASGCNPPSPLTMGVLRLQEMMG